MLHRTAGSAAIIAIALFVCVPASWAQEVRIVSPREGSMVRGVVELRTVKAAGGWVSYKISAAGKEGDYVAAVIEPFAFKWDTRAKDAKGNPLYPDGDYVITATAYDPSGNPAGEASVTVTVANRVPASEVGGPVLLRCAYQRAQQYAHRANGKLTATLPEKDQKQTGIPLHLDVLMRAEWESEVLTPTSGDSPAVIDVTVKSGYIQVVGAEGVRLPGAGKQFRLKVFPDGLVELFRRSEGDHFPLSEYFVKLPPRPVTTGDTWNGDVLVLPLPVAEGRHVVSAQHKLDGFEYVAGRRCARITTQVSEKDKTVVVRIGHVVYPIKTSYTINRASYFGIDAKRFVAFEETAKHTIKLPYQAVQLLYQLQLGQSAQTAAAGAAGMMGGAMQPGMGMPGMGPMGGMPPEMMGAAGVPGGPAMMGMPGAPGMAMPGMEGPGAGAYMPGMMPGVMGAAGGYQMQDVNVEIVSTLSIIEQSSEAPEAASTSEK